MISWYSVTSSSMSVKQRRAIGQACTIFDHRGSDGSGMLRWSFIGAVDSMFMPIFAAFRLRPPRRFLRRPAVVKYGSKRLGRVSAHAVRRTRSSPPREASKKPMLLSTSGAARYCGAYLWVQIRRGDHEVCSVTVNMQLDLRLPILTRNDMPETACRLRTRFAVHAAICFGMILGSC